eukprot:s164_g53.t1
MVVRRSFNLNAMLHGRLGLEYLGYDVLCVRVFVCVCIYLSSSISPQYAGHARCISRQHLLEMLEFCSERWTWLENITEVSTPGGSETSHIQWLWISGLAKASRLYQQTTTITATYCNTNSNILKSFKSVFHFKSTLQHLGATSAMRDLSFRIREFVMPWRLSHLGRASSLTKHRTCNLRRERLGVLPTVTL